MVGKLPAEVNTRFGILAQVRGRCLRVAVSPLPGGVGVRACVDLPTGAAYDANEAAPGEAPPHDRQGGRGLRHSAKSVPERFFPLLRNEEQRVELHSGFILPGCVCRPVLSGKKGGCHV